jgi:hypothetical protein
MKLPLIVVGVLSSLGAAQWWHSEVFNVFGSRTPSGGFRCLLLAGTGDCHQLWFVGLHQANITASLIFYAGALMTIFGCLMPNWRKDNHL